MGKNNRQRRKEKVKKRKAAGRAKKPTSGPDLPGARQPFDTFHDPYPPPPSDPERAASYWQVLAYAPTESRDRPVALDSLMAMGTTVAYRAATKLLQKQVSWLWSNHWLPAEAIRHVRNATSAVGAEIIATAIAIDHAGRKPETLHAHWRQHIAQLDLPKPPPGVWLQTLSTANRQRRNVRVDEFVLLVADVIREADIGVTMLEIIPPPDSLAARAGTNLAERTATGSPMLDKVRHLLAQAESTTFDAEAEAFTAKAQELMARHALDEALVWARTESSERPAKNRLPIDDPYADAKHFLLHVVSEQSKCRAVGHSNLGLSTIIGFEDDLRSVETLFTSLLLQAQTSLQRAAAAAPPGDHSRSRRFRSSFLMAYADRVSERLAEINDHVRQEAEVSVGDQLLPVLASRSTAIDEEVDRLFTELRHSTSRSTNDLAGLMAGRNAADQANLNDLVTP